jgi:hypothetical protein
MKREMVKPLRQLNPTTPRDVLAGFRQLWQGCWGGPFTELPSLAGARLRRHQAIQDKPFIFNDLRALSCAWPELARVLLHVH